MWRIKLWPGWARRVPIRWRLIIVSLGLLTLLLTVLGVVILFAAEQALESNEADALQNEAHLVMKSVDRPQHTLLLTIARGPAPPTGVLTPNLLIVAGTLAQKLDSPRSEAAILSPQGVVLASTNETAFALSAVRLPPSTVQQALASGQTEGRYWFARDAQHNRQLVVLLPLVNQGGHTVAVLQISTPTEQIDAFVTALRLILLLGAIGALGIATALTIPLMNAALRPLVEMERTSRRIAEGDLSLRLAMPLTDDEIGRLAHSFNQMVAQLEMAFQRQKRFVADASHELRTPLTALSGSLEMLLLGADSGDKEASRRLLRGMYMEVRRMHRLAEDLLDLTRLDEGQIRMREDVVSVHEIIDKVYHQAQQIAHGQTITREVAAGIPPVRVDSDRIQQVLLNIADNALKATPEDGKVALLARYKKEESVVLIEVKDTGKGIPAEDLPYVFDRFYRVDPARSRVPRRAGGNGLGLAIARELVEAQGGKITIASEVGIGTTLTIQLCAA